MIHLTGKVAQYRLHTMLKEALDCRNLPANLISKLCKHLANNL